MPIILGGASKPALRRAGKYAHGWMGNGNTLDEMPSIFASLNESRAKHGRSDQDFEIILALKDKASVADLKALEEKGATATVLGFPDNSVSLQEKIRFLALLDGYMKQF